MILLLCIALIILVAGVFFHLHHRNYFSLLIFVLSISFYSLLMLIPDNQGLVDIVILWMAVPLASYLVGYRILFIDRNKPLLKGLMDFDSMPIDKQRYMVSLYFVFLVLCLIKILLYGV